MMPIKTDTDTEEYKNCITCQCAFYQNYSLLCAHIFSVFTVLQIKNLSTAANLTNWRIKRKEAESKPELRLKTYIESLNDTYEAKKMKHKAGKIHVKNQIRRKMIFC